MIERSHRILTSVTYTASKPTPFRARPGTRPAPPQPHGEHRRTMTEHIQQPGLCPCSLCLGRASENRTCTAGADPAPGRPHRLDGCPGSLKMPPRPCGAIDLSATVELIYDGSSGCHRAAAVALRDAIVERGLSWDVRIVCIQALLAPGASRLFHRSRVHALSGYWSERRPDLVVSLLPHFSRALQESLDRTHPGSPLVTVLTDIADYPPRFWMERREQELICRLGG